MRKSNETYFRFNYQIINDLSLYPWKSKVVLILRRQWVTQEIVIKITNLRCHRWRQSWHLDNSRFSVITDWGHTTYLPRKIYSLGTNAIGQYWFLKFPRWSCWVSDWSIWFRTWPRGVPAGHLSANAELRLSRLDPFKFCLTIVKRVMTSNLL